MRSSVPRVNPWATVLARGFAAVEALRLVELRPIFIFRGILGECEWPRDNSDNAASAARHGSTESADIASWRATSTCAAAKSILSRGVDERSYSSKSKRVRES